MGLILLLFSLCLSVNTTFILHKTQPLAAPLQFPLPDSEVPYYDFTKFNYNGPCHKIFSEAPHTHRDVILFGNGPFSTRQKYYLFQTDFALRLLRRTLPRVRLVLFWFGDITPTVQRYFDKYAVEVYLVKDASGWHPANGRLIAGLQWLREHRAEVDRVLFSDLRDVYHFADTFATVSTDKLVFLRQGNSDAPSSFREDVVYNWMATYYGVEVAMKMAYSAFPIVNVGYIIGGADHLIEALRVITEAFNPVYRNYWGYEQTVMNYLIFNGKLDHIPHSFDICSQRICFNQIKYFRYQDNAMFIQKTGCSPVARHKGIPHDRGLVDNSLFA